MSDETALLYLETDDEVTSVVRRVRGADVERVVLVVPGRSRATSSAVALRLLARVGEEAGRRVGVVGDALTRSLASEAGLEAFATVSDARNAVPAEVGAHGKGASIHVVRGDVSDEAVPIAAALSPAPPRNDSDTQTRPVAVPRTEDLRPRPVAASRRSGRALPIALILGGLATLLLAAVVLGAVVLPAATVTIVPRSEPLGPVPYGVRIDDPERLTGTVEAEVPVTATGTYPVQAAATGTVVFRNFNTVDVAVGSGTLVAAGEQAFETLAEIVVPAGMLTGAGTIQAGEEAVGVAASAVGPGANVAADAIDTILAQNVAARLRGFPNNTSRLVLNPEATAGGVDTTGPEITQADVDAARTALGEALDVALTDALEGSGEAIFADPTEPAEPVVEGLEGLVETRDQETASISGSLAYDRLVVDRDEVIPLAEARLVDDANVVASSHELLPDATRVTIGDARRDGDAIVVSVSVTGASTPVIDRGEVIDRVQGESLEAATEALVELGEPSIELWPGWVASVPELDWRIDVQVVTRP
ncbi:MAG: hypothetical protein ACRDG7_17385 [Candidatus Limnocylindria bacterium]